MYFSGPTAKGRERKVKDGREVREERERGERKREGRREKFKRRRDFVLCHRKKTTSSAPLQRNRNYARGQLGAKVRKYRVRDWEGLSSSYWGEFKQAVLELS